MQLLDRERDLDVLSAALVRAVAGQGRVALVTGEAGIGKTSLLRAFLSGIAPEIRVLKGACEDLKVAEPLGPLRDLLRDVEPELAKGISGTDNLLSLFDEVLSICAAQPAGTVVVLEDLHWADDSTADLVRFLARRVGDHPIFLIVSARAEQAANRQLVRQVFGDLPTEILHRIPLAPLSEVAVAQLCQGTNRDPERVFRASGGNAFYVCELLQNSGESLPLSIRDAVLSRVDRLDRDARAVLETASVMPRRAEISHVAAVLRGDIDLEPAIERCLDAGLLATDGTSLIFPHELARQAVFSALSPIRSRRLNMELFRRLSDVEDVGLSRLLHHAQGAGDMSAVARLAPSAARSAASLGARREAAAFFSIAVDAAGDAADGDLLEEAAWASYMAGEHSIAADYQIRAMAGFDEATDPLRRGEAFRKLSRYHWVRSDTVRALEAIDEAIAELLERPGPELAQAYSSQSQLYMTAYRMDDVVKPAEAAIALARELDRPEIISHALNNLAMSHVHRDTNRARELMAESLEIALRIDDPDNAGRAMVNWMTLEYDSCEFVNALERAQISAAFAQERELGAYHRYSLGMLARAKHQLGQWDEVIEPARRGFDYDGGAPENFSFYGAIALLMDAVRRGAQPDPNLFEYLAHFDHQDAEGQRIGPYAEMMAERAWLAKANLETEIQRLNMVAEKTPLPEMIGGVHVWLKRLDQATELKDLSRFPEPHRLELSGDRQGAARAWAERCAPYEEAMTLAFGSTEDQARALEIFQSLGASPAITRMSGSLGTKRASLGRPPAAGPHGLTSRQLDVLRLMDEGLTNGQIGDRLYISPKTVDHHVSAILGKLEASSRGEAASKARRLGLV